MTSKTGDQFRSRLESPGIKIPIKQPGFNPITDPWDDCMTIVYLATFTLRINHSCRQIYNRPMDPWRFPRSRKSRQSDRTSKSAGSGITGGTVAPWLQHMVMVFPTSELSPGFFVAKGRVVGHPNSLKQALLKKNTKKAGGLGLGFSEPST